MVPRLMVFWINGRIVACCTFSSMRMTTSPPRCNIPKIGGFSLASVPRPRSPVRRRRRPGRPFFSPPRGGPYGPHDIDFVTFDLPGERRRRPAVDDPLAQLLDHLP